MSKQQQVTRYIVVKGGSITPTFDVVDRERENLVVEGGFFSHAAAEREAANLNAKVVK